MEKSAQIQIRVSERQKDEIRRAAKALGQTITDYVLSRVLPDERSEFQSLCDAAAGPRTRTSALAALNDLLTSLPPTRFRRAVADPPIGLDDPLWRNYVAAMVETAAYRHRMKPPGWVAEVTPLSDPWFASEFPSLRLHLLCESPPAFRRRNLFVDATIGDRV